MWNLCQQSEDSYNLLFALLQRLVTIWMPSCSWKGEFVVIRLDNKMSPCWLYTSALTSLKGDLGGDWNVKTSATHIQVFSWKTDAFSFSLFHSAHFHLEIQPGLIEKKTGNNSCIFTEPLSFSLDKAWWQTGKQSRTFTAHDFETSLKVNCLGIGGKLWFFK